MRLMSNDLGPIKINGPRNELERDMIIDTVIALHLYVRGCYAVCTSKNKYHFLVELCTFYNMVNTLTTSRAVVFCDSEHYRPSLVDSDE